MDDLKCWYEEMPEVFERERKILESRGFSLNNNKNTIEFIGCSSVLNQYPLKIVYPNGYPSFPPTVFSNVSDELILLRHHSKLSKILCCFGFSSERWRADFTAKEVLQEAEELIAHFSPLTFEDEQNNSFDDVPEPFVNQYNYSFDSIVIPAPFGDMKYNEFYGVSKSLIKFSNKQKRGILKSLDSKYTSKTIADGYADWFEESTLHNAMIFKVDNPPPLTTTHIYSWLEENNIRIKSKNNQFIFIVFEDESGIKGNKRVAWICLKIIQTSAHWVRCYLVCEDDINIRTTYGSQLSSKHITIIGAGSLGSIVSTTLAQEGVFKLSLFDYDVYEPSNSIRHQVKQSWFGYSKVIGVSHRIKELSPNTITNVYNIAVGSNKDWKVAQETIEVLLASDIVVDTTGEHSVSHFLNRFCVANKIPLVVGSVTNGAWSCEVVRYIPNESGCWGCWNRNYGDSNPPSSPKGDMQFAPGCDQPTFIGGISSVNIAGGLISQGVIDTLLDTSLDENHYVLWNEKDSEGKRNYQVKYYMNPALQDCEVCNENK